MSKNGQKWLYNKSSVVIDLKCYLKGYETSLQKKPSCLSCKSVNTLQ